VDLKFTRNEPSRIFEVGYAVKRSITDCGRVELGADEQITFVTEAGNEYDVTRKSFGFYATPSLNGRLEKFSLRAVLTKNISGKFFLLLIEKGKEDDFLKYLEEERMDIICWMDSSESLGKIEFALAGVNRYEQ
jgi:hypothetical protein